MPLDKRICPACVSDEYLKAEIAKSPTVDQKCDYCETVRPTMDMWSLAWRCDSVIENFYEMPGRTCGAVTICERTPESKELARVLG